MLTARPDRYPARVKRRLIFPPAYPSETRLRAPDEPPYLKVAPGDPINQLVDSPGIRQFAGIRFDGDYRVIRGGNLLPAPIRSGDLL